jgi:hypothetical protein
MSPSDIEINLISFCKFKVLKRSPSRSISRRIALAQRFTGRSLTVTVTVPSPTGKSPGAGPSGLAGGGLCLAGADSDVAGPTGTNDSSRAYLRSTGTHQRPAQSSTRKFEQFKCHDSDQWPSDSESGEFESQAFNTASRYPDGTPGTLMICSRSSHLFD